MTVRPAKLALPILREALPGATIGTWEPGADHRQLPYVHLRRDGGIGSGMPDLLTFPVVEMTAYSAESPGDAEDIYLDALGALRAAVRRRKVVPGVGHVHSLAETQGATQVASRVPDTFAVEGKVRLGIRPAA